MDMFKQSPRVMQIQAFGKVIAQLKKGKEEFMHNQAIEDSLLKIENASGYFKPVVMYHNQESNLWFRSSLWGKKSPKSLQWQDNLSSLDLLSIRLAISRLSGTGETKESSRPSEPTKCSS
ncbi:hypothetical protein CJ030_MR8G022080 [Morella rubra]|uniref:Uncharacterized protein n=1 Tax=Morella rubra TaxID=262757 RepID=A0A6A1URG9_9ROSI|nr:hypothetical protein CJ030_MR8G022080 [Morella rubra]